MLCSGAIGIVFILGLSSWTESGNYHNDTISKSADFVCDRCDGNKHDPVVKCRNCEGSGTITVKITCTQCLGDGVVTDKYGKNHTCPSCYGNKTIPQKQYCSSCDGWGHPSCTKCKGTGRVTRN